MKRRRSADQPDEGYTGPFAGNCGRSIDQECGLVNVWDCCVHGPLQIALDEDDTSKVARRAVRREIEAEFAKAKVRPRDLAMNRRQHAIQARVGDSLSQVRTEIARERWRGLTKTMIATLASAKLQRW